MNVRTISWIIAGLAVYLASIAALLRSPAYSPEEAIFAFGIFGIFLPGMAWLMTRKTKLLGFNCEPETGEMITVAAYVAFVFLYLIFGVSAIDGILPTAVAASPKALFLFVIIKKLLVFVVIPYAIFSCVFGYTLSDFGFRREALRELFRSHLPVLVVLGALLTALQYFIGNGAAPIRKGEFTGSEIALSLPICFAALCLEVGIVEEFFYRSFLQSRVAGFFRSELAGLVLTAIVFAVSHAPGMVLRQAGAVDGLGTAPMAWEAVAYTIATISLVSLMFGIIWIRTRNLYLLVTIHAITDLLPNLPEFIRTWRP